MNPPLDSEQTPIQCCGCKKKFFSNGFRVTRLGRRLKTCIECNDRQAKKQRRYLARRESGVVYKDTFLGYLERVPQLSSHWLLLALERELNPVEPWKHPVDFFECMTLYESAQQSALREASKGPKLTDDEVTDLIAGLCLEKHNEVKKADQQRSKDTEELLSKEQPRYSKAESRMDHITTLSGCSSCRSPLESYNKDGLCTQCNAHEWVKNEAICREIDELLQREKALNARHDRKKGQTTK